MHLRRFFISALAAVIVSGTTNAVIAQGYPERPVEIIVPWSPGAITDVLGRALAKELTINLGQSFIIVDKAGATSAIGTAAVARANHDGYSLLFTAAVSVTVVPLINKEAGYELKAFTPICQTFKNEMAIVVRPDSPYKSVGDLVNAAKAKPGGITYGHLGIGSIPHLAMVEFSQVAKAEFNAIPYKGDADIKQQVLGGQIDFGVMVLSSAAGSDLRILGIFSGQRNPAIPDVATIKEQGFAVTPSSFGGLIAPTGIPAEVKRKLSEACKAAALAESYAKLAKSVFQPNDYYADGESFADSLDKDVAEKSRLLQSLGELK
ncbi:MAG: tripartite tricarboxylate transporter substrate binding protein [Xanthobacteraceae bacterium]|jgi:tripartite-type tricarboxylate transporter receptor subunit TctC